MNSPVPVLMIHTSDLSRSATFPSIRAAARHIGQGEGSRKSISAGTKTKDGSTVNGTRRGRKGVWFATRAK